ncbi:hypothetical protein Tco_0876316 [Tanacetum coccineum]|uniref:Reverse transcriptase domain-containing protein n=1 Tax=Tanacetum coccineum TaxID=301880 RepID=A0ABQ5BRY8_9ASTR
MNVIKVEVSNLLDADDLPHLPDIPLGDGLIHVVPKKRGTTVITNEDNELIPERLIPIDPRDQAENHLHLPLWNICLPKAAFRSFQCSWDFPKVHGGYLHDMIEKTMEVFMDDFLVFGDSFSSCLFHLDMMLKSGIEVDQAKVDVIVKLPPPTTVKGIRSFLDHSDFYRRFI